MVPNYMIMHNKSESEFLLLKVKYTRSHEHLVSCLAMEHMRTIIVPTSTLHSPDAIHVISVHRHSPFLATVLLLCIILNTNQRAKERGRPRLLCFILNTNQREKEQGRHGTNATSWTQRRILATENHRQG